MQIKLTPKISIVSPSYNQGEFIECAILSVLNQGYANFEHIIIDGGSTDNTIEILKKYTHLIWVSEKDNGQSDAINKGFDKVTGDIVGWLNTDDYYLSGAFDAITEKFSCTNADVIYGDIQFVDKNGNITKKGVSRVPIQWLILFHCYIHSAAFFMKREVLYSGIRIDPEMYIAMDKDFFAHVFHEKFKFKYIHKTLTSFRWHDNNKSIDTEIVKQIRYREGLIIFNKYSGYNLAITPFNIKLYVIAQRVLSPFKKALKLYSIFFIKN